MAESTSACEQRAVKAERQLKDIKKARFIKKYLGQEMEGVICGVVRFGFFVKLRLFDVEGLVHLKGLPGKWEFEESLLELRPHTTRSKGKSKKKKGETLYSQNESGKKLLLPKCFKMGDPVLIQVASANIETAQVEFDLTEHRGVEVIQKKAQAFKKKPRSSKFSAGKKSAGKKSAKSSKRRARKKHRRKKEEQSLLTKHSSASQTDEKNKLPGKKKQRRRRRRRQERNQQALSTGHKATSSENRGKNKKNQKFFKKKRPKSSKNQRKKHTV